MSGSLSLQYKHPATGKRWHCLRRERLQECFADVSLPDELPVIHAALEGIGGLVWTVCRRWFGLQPMVPPEDYDPLDLAEFATADELESSVGLKRGGLRQELAAALGAVTAARPRHRELKQAEAAAKASRAASFSGELPLTPPESPMQVIESAGFGFVYSGAAGAKLAENPPALADEQQWLASRIAAWRKPLTDAQVSALARSILLKELLIRRLEGRLVSTDMSIAGKETAELMRQLTAEQNAYGNMLKQLDELAPWMNAVSGRVKLQGVVADLIRLLQEVAVSRDEALVDGFFTATEVQVLLNGSRQLPDPQYRPDVVVMVNQARQHLWNRDWRGSFTAGQFRRIREAWMAAEAAVRQNLTQEQSDRVPDFMDDGPGGEFPDLVEPSGEDAEQP